MWKELLVELLLFIALKLARHADVRACLDMSLSDIHFWHSEGK